MCELEKNSIKLLDVRVRSGAQRGEPLLPKVEVLRPNIVPISEGTLNRQSSAFRMVKTEGIICRSGAARLRHNRLKICHGLMITSWVRSPPAAVAWR